MTIDKTFDPAAIEARWYAHWEDKGLFRPERPDAEPFTIVIPPPNVTGSLHIGHALDDTLQDVLVRHARLKGKDALWVVGTDHAGIATQMVVERQLNAKGQKRTDFDRDAFIAKVWEWKEESGGTITRQLRRLGASCDWANERFTMDEGFSRAVLKVFVDLYNQKLLYRDKRLVNWDPGLKTAISDLEVETKEVQGHFWHFSYPLADGSGTISVATTRPETMLADMAVAVNPEDERYKALIGKQVRLPITGRLIPIVADEHADPELGSGAVKITPGHDFNDFEVGKRAGFKPAEMLNMLDADAKVVQTSDGLIPADYLGLDRFEARKMVVAAIEAAGLLEKIEDRVIQTPKGDRSGAVIEPWLTDQWYVDAETLAKPAIEAVRSGAIRIVPESWSKTYFNWLENIQPWCVSRQLWWGHQIPAWYDEDGNVFVAENEEEAKALAGGRTLTRDPDVLDTWFSSALWPFGTLGWPDEVMGNPSLSGETPPPTAPLKERGLLARHYPNDVLISGFDILFFWDARMIMQGLHFMGEVPFKTLYLHGLVRAADGSKMSKSKGNTVDPLGLIDTYGADALRFTLTAMESQGRDIKLDEKRVEGYRNFATKLWNAARFAQGNGIGASTSIEAPSAQLAVNRWIIAETMKTVKALDRAIEDLRYDEAANTIYHFVWASFCDWYIELSKPLLGEDADPAQAAETRAVAGWALDQILVMLHPFMPFITEELWHALGERPYELILAKWPLFDEGAIDADAQAEIDWLIRLVSEVRAARNGLNVPPGTRLPAYSRGASEQTLARLRANATAIARLARIDPAEGEAPAGGAAQVVVDEATFVLPLEGVIDLDAERARLAKAIAAAEKERDGLANRLNNPAFVEKAKPEAVEKARADHAEKSLEAEQLSAALARLG
ncbi:valine--tRNA ligase [Rhizorhabdus sp.]|uniref:valine--tRNA ligase n=2 Tax=Rhizorhabdus sp. TaxID=1968843 RepID=UPI0035B245CA